MQEDEWTKEDVEAMRTAVESRPSFCERFADDRVDFAPPDVLDDNAPVHSEHNPVCSDFRCQCWQEVSHAK